MSDEQAVVPAPPAEVTQPLLSHRRRLAAWGLAALADLVQLVFVPLFGEGAASPVNEAVDVVVALGLTWLVGFHWSFLPTLLVESLPVVDLAPTWTGAVFLATRRKGK